MGGWQRPAGPVEAARRASAPSHAPPFSLFFTLNQSRHPLLVLDRSKRGGAGRSRARPKNFEIFCEVLLMQNFQILNMGWLKFKHDYARWNENLCKEKLNYPICNANDGYVPRISWQGLGF